jgi:hypothetical protein
LSDLRSLLAGHSPKTVPAFFNGVLLALSVRSQVSYGLRGIGSTMMISTLKITAIALALAYTGSLQADDIYPPDVWRGSWLAEGTPFALRVIPAGTRFTALPLLPVGIEWRASNGMINGNSGTIEVEYQGVSAQVLVQLLDKDSAIVRSMSCQPDYHVICTLVRNQQARFVRQSED